MKIDFNAKVKEFYELNKDKVVCKINNRNGEEFYLIEINEKFITDYFVVCPICGFIKSTIVLHIIKKHKITTKDFKENFPNYKLGSFKYFSNASFFRLKSIAWRSITWREKIAARMRNNNPMKRIDIRDKVSKTRKFKFKNDKNFRDMQLNNFAIMCNSIKENNDCFKIPGWGLSGKYNNSIFFRSKNELKTLIWFKQNNILKFVENNIPFKLNGKIYFADFKIGNIIYEVKTRRYLGKYIPTKREIQQFSILKHLEFEGYKVNILYNDSDEIKAITMIDILREYINGNIIFSKNSLEMPFTKKIIEEAKQYAEYN